MAEAISNIERCPIHPQVDPIMVTVHETESRNPGDPTRVIREPRCPICG